MIVISEFSPYIDTTLFLCSLEQLQILYFFFSRPFGKLKVDIFSRTDQYPHTNYDQKCDCLKYKFYKRPFIAAYQAAFAFPIELFECYLNFLPSCNSYVRDCSSIIIENTFSIFNTKRGREINSFIRDAFRVFLNSNERRRMFYAFESLAYERRMEGFWLYFLVCIDDGVIIFTEFGEVFSTRKDTNGGTTSFRIFPSNDTELLSKK